MEKKEVIAISPSSSEKEESPLRSMVCLKRDMDMKQFEEKADCFILDFDPFDSIGFTSLSVPENVDGDNGDVSIIGEKGQQVFFCAKSIFLTHCKMGVLCSVAVMFAIQLHRVVSGRSLDHHIVEPQTTLHVGSCKGLLGKANPALLNSVLRSSTKVTSVVHRDAGGCWMFLLHINDNITVPLAS